MIKPLSYSPVFSGKKGNVGVAPQKRGEQAVWGEKEERFIRVLLRGLVPKGVPSRQPGGKEAT